MVVATWTILLSIIPLSIYIGIKSEELHDRLDERKERK
jgi:pantothenate kinase